MKTKSILLLLTLAFVAAAGQAQECKVTDKVIDCWMRFNPAAGSAVTQKARAEAETQKAEADTQKTVAAANTGISSLVSPSATVVKDFLSLLSASVESKSLTSNGQSLTLDYNPPINILGADHALKLQATFAEPKLNGQLTTARTGAGSRAIPTSADSSSATHARTASFTRSSMGARCRGPSRARATDASI